MRGGRGGEVSTTEKFEIDERLKKLIYQNMRLLNEALKQASNSVQKPNKVNSKKK